MKQIYLLLFGLVFYSNVFAQPTNDDCATAMAIVIPPSGNACINSSTLTATGVTYTSHPCFPTGVNLNDVWFTFVTSGVQNTVTITPANGAAGIDQPGVTMLSNGCGNPMDECNVAATNNGIATVSKSYPVATQIWINVAGIAGDGNFEICIESISPPPSPGNDCNNASVICDMASFNVPDMAGFTPSGTFPSCFLFVAQQDAWYQFTIGQSGTLEWTVSPSGAAEFDWALYDITGGCPGVEVACNYNYASGNGSPIGMTPGGTGEFDPPINVTVGSTYALLIDNYTASGPPVGFDFDWGNGTATIAPNSDFSVTYPPCTLPVSATITNNSTAAVSYSWDFGQGTTSTAQNPASPTYSSIGTYMISLVTTSATGCTNVASQPVNVVNCCAMTGLTASMTACRNAPFLEYDMGGQVTFTDPPATGQLIVQNCYGQQQVFNPPFVSPQAYTFTALPQTGNVCDITAYFTDDATCTITTPMQAPPPITFYSSNCTMGSGAVNGTIEFTNPNNVGTSLVISIFDGTTSIDTVILPPFTSPQAWSVSGLDPSFNPYTIDYYFTDYQSCGNQQTINCGCSADAGTTTVTTTGNGNTNYVLCENDVLDINSDGNWFAPDDTGPLGGFAYQPGLAYLVYTCPPTPGVYPGNDPCFYTIIPVSEDLNNTNNANAYFDLLGGDANFTDNTLYYTPITLYHYDPVNNNYILNSNCWDIGPVTSVVYLEPITSSIAPNCQDSSVTVTLMGGHPENYGTDFTASNLLPATASFVNTTCSHNGTIMINGLLNGDMYSFDVVDQNGCPHTISGGPFVGLPSANAGLDDTICGSLTYGLQAVPSYGTGSWSGAGVNFSAASSPTSNMTAGGPGTYALTWTENNGGGCVSSDVVNITVSNLSFTENITPSTCGASDGQIVITATGGVAPLQYSNDNGLTFQASNTFSNLASGSYDIVVEDALGCQSTNVINVSDVGGVVINSITPVAETCPGICNGSIAINATGGTQFSIDNGVTFQASNVFLNLCAGNYNIVVQDANGCNASGVTSIGSPTAITATHTTVNLVCANACIGQISFTASGGTPPLSYSINNGVSFQAGATFTGLCAGSYNLVVQDANGCQFTNTATINQPNPLGWTVQSDDVSCFGACDGWITCFPNGGVSPYFYSWTPTAVSADQPSLTNLCVGSYGVTLTDNNGCSIDTTGIIISGPMAIVIDGVVVTHETCFGDADGTLTINATGGTEYSLDGITFQSSNQFMGMPPGNYTFYVRDANGCTVQGVATINPAQEVSITASQDTIICVGGTATISGNALGGVGPYTYEWSGGQLTQTISVNPTSVTVYDVMAYDVNGCPSPSESVVVSMYSALSVNAFSNQTICEGSAAVVSAFGSGGYGNLTYTWDENLGEGTQFTVNPVGTTTYTVTLTDECTTPPATASVTITVSANPTVSFSADVVEGCVPLTVTFTGLSSDDCFWNFGDGYTATDCGTTTHTYTSLGSFDVSLVLTNSDGCSTTMSIDDYINVYGYPTAGFSFGPQPTTVLNPTINFTNESVNAVDYNWTFDYYGMAYTDDAVNPSFAFSSQDSGSYVVCLEAITENGCVDTICKTVVIDEEISVYVPNAFTPENDDMLNNIFIPVVHGIDESKYQFYVFNRWGQLIFESQHSQIGWDGRYKGTLSQTDVYVWKLYVSDMRGKKYEYTGHVTLLK